MFARDTIRTVVTRVRSDLDAAFGQYPIPATVEERLAKLVGGYAHGLYGHLQFQVAQILLDRCEDDIAVRWARILGLSPRAGSKATGNAEFSAPANDTIPAGAVAKVGAVEFVVVSSSATGGTCTAVLEAADTGSAGNFDAGEVIRLQSPVAGVDSEGVLASGGTASGTEPESVDQLRERLLYRYAHPPRGGAAGDYVSWALEVPGVLRAWEYPERTSARTVDLLFVDENESDPLLVTIPDSSRVAAVQAHLDARAPSTMTIDVIAPTAQPVAFEVLVTPTVSAVEAPVVEQLQLLLRDRVAPGDTLALSRIAAAISEAAGETDHSLSAPASAVASSSADHLLTYGSTTFLV